MIGIYKITNPNGKIYIGQSINVNRRLTAHKNRHSSKCILVYNSITKYGKENHTFELIEECEKDMLDERELYWTEYYNALHPNGLVLKAGGEPGVGVRCICSSVRGGGTNDFSRQQHKRFEETPNYGVKM